jgi:cobalt/nickel transport system permease protein
MHIPDGYLSPSTCATLYAASAPFWYVALRRVKAALSGQTIPLLAVFAAFSFVVMMFNLPLPGGTTGHAVGMAIGAIVLGPAVSIMAVSMALLIQALFFGDGGITAYGANCFNMAIVGSLVAYVVYRVLAGKAALRSKRRVVAAALAGYTAINAAAFCAAIEFGVQPSWFHDTNGAPLYAPYSLHVAIPAMMIGHLTIAGLAELVITAGLVSYLQRSNVELLRKTAVGVEIDSAAANIRPTRGLWVTLGVLVVLTPLGILAAGKAWGEWKPRDFSKAPPGLESLAKLWQAPLADYAPPFIGNAAGGYLVSAVLGVGLILLSVWAGRTLLARGVRKHGGFVEKTIRGLITAGQEALFAEGAAQSDGLLQRLDPRVKIAGLGALIIAAVSVRRLWVLLALFGLSVLGALASRISLRVLAIRVWVTVLAFTGVIALPAIFFGAGSEVWRLPVVEWTIYAGGLRSALFLVLRAETCATFSLLLILTTLWNHLLRSLRFLGVPAAAVAVVSMTYRYIFVFLDSAKNTLEARQTRLVGNLEPAVERRLAAASVGALLDKTMHLSVEVYTAMQARGFRGEIRLLNDLQMRGRDWWQLSALLAMAMLALGLGR